MDQGDGQLFRPSAARVLQKPAEKYRQAKSGVKRYRFRRMVSFPRIEPFSRCRTVLFLVERPRFSLTIYDLYPGANHWDMVYFFSLSAPALVCAQIISTLYMIIY